MKSFEPLCRIIALLVVQFTFTVLCQDAVVTIKNGTVTGTVETVDKRQIWQFLGIPFAEPPVGQLRLRRAQSIKEKWTEPLHATKPPNGCLQTAIELVPVPDHLKANYSEDCLYLNIWTPSLDTKHKKTVMVFIHGGGFASGESLPLYNGKALASIGDVVVVGIQYRLGFLGFARFDKNLISGNMGLFDQQLALKWVQENIDQFGGNPESVTIFGESAGAISVSMHLMNEESSRYFHRAIMQSGAAYNMLAGNPNTEAMEQGARDMVSKYLNCGQNTLEEILKCLEEKSEAEMLGAITRHNFENTSAPRFYPVTDGRFFSALPKDLITSGKVSKKDLILGVCEDEGLIFVGYAYEGYKAILNITSEGNEFMDKRFVDLAIDQMFKYYPHYPQVMSPLAMEALRLRSISHVDPTNGNLNYRKLSATIGQYMVHCDTNAFADYMSAVHDKVYFYEMAHNPIKPVIPGKRPAATHGDDILFVFHAPLLYPHLVNSMTEEEEFLSRRIIADFTTFAKTGQPRDPNWRPYTAKKKEYYRYAIVSRLQKNGQQAQECGFWNRILPMLNSAVCKMDKDGQCVLSTQSSSEAEESNPARGSKSGEL